MIRIREKSVPLLLPFAAVIAGIILGSVSAAGTAFISYAGIALSLLALAALKIYKKSRFIPHAVLLLLFFFSSLNYKFNIAPSKNDVSGMVPFRGEITGTVKLSRRNFIVKADLAEGRKVRGSVLVRYDGSIPRQGARVKISGDFKNPPGPQNPGQFDWKKYLACNRIFTECDARQVEVIKENFIVKYVGSVREYIEKSIKAYLPEDEAGVLLGMLLGDVSKVPRELFEQFRYAGIVHVLAVSGLHVGLVLFTFYYILTAFGTGKERALLVSLVFMALYVVITGARPSAVRAAVMLFMLTAGRMMGERGNVYNSLCFAGIIILLVRPGLLFTLGFVLSFTAVAGIIYLYPFFAKFMWRPLAVSLSAMLGISPVLAWNFYYLPLISPLTNLLVVPLAGISIGLGMLVVIVSLVSSKAAMIYGISLSYLIKLLMLITGIVRNAGIGGVTVPRPPGLAAAGICLLLASIGIKRRSLRWKAVIVSIALVLSGTARNLFFARGFLAALSSEKSFSYIIALEPRETVVFDGKNDMDTDAVRSFLYSRGIGKVRDLYIIHPPYEFRKNTLGFIREFGVKRVFWPGTAGNENNWRRFTDLSSGIEIIPVMKGDSMDYGGSRVDILEPCKKYLDIRDNYIQARVTGKERILVYAGGGIPDEKYGYVIVDGAYEPDWPGLEEKRPGTLIFSGEDTPPFKAENIGSKGRIFYF